MPITPYPPKADDANLDTLVLKTFEDNDDFPSDIPKRVDGKFGLKPMQDVILLLRDLVLADLGGLRARNNSGGAFGRATLFYISGYDATNDRHELTGARADLASTLAGYVIDKDVATATNIVAYTNRIVTGIAGQVVDTSGRTEGDAVYLSAVTPGAFTFTAPTSPNIPQQVGIVLVVDAILGSILFNPGGTFGGDKSTGPAVTLAFNPTQAKELL